MRQHVENWLAGAESGLEGGGGWKGDEGFGVG